MAKSIDNTFMWRVIILLVVILFTINLVKANRSLKKINKEKFTGWDWFSNGFATITESGSSGALMCAKSCCYSGWPSSIDLNESAFGVKPGDMGVKYRATNLRCNNGFTTGCVCNAI
jgi:hypothetical protein